MPFFKTNNPGCTCCDSCICGPLGYNSTLNDYPVSGYHLSGATGITDQDCSSCDSYNIASGDTFIELCWDSATSAWDSFVTDPCGASSLPHWRMKALSANTMRLYANSGTEGGVATYDHTGNFNVAASTTFTQASVSTECNNVPTTVTIDPCATCSSSGVTGKVCTNAHDEPDAWLVTLSNIGNRNCDCANQFNRSFVLNRGVDCVGSTWPTNSFCVYSTSGFGPACGGAVLCQWSLCLAYYLFGGRTAFDLGLYISSPSPVIACPVDGSTTAEITWEKTGGPFDCTASHSLSVVLEGTAFACRGANSVANITPL